MLPACVALPVVPPATMNAFVPSRLAVALFACSLFAGVACGPPIVGALKAAGGEAFALLAYAAGALLLAYAAPIILKADADEG